MPERIATRVSETFFNSVQLDAGILVKGWDPDKPTTITDSMIICATTGGINPTCVPTYSDLYEDVDNAPNNTKEGLHLDGWDCGISTTAVTHDLDTIKLALGAADKDATAHSVSPRTYIKDDDFSDLAWLGDMADGSIAAVVLTNALSTGGYSLQTSKNGKGNLDLTISGYASIKTQTEVPMKFYIIPSSTSDDTDEDTDEEGTNN